LEATDYRTTASYDALNRVKRMQFPQDVEGRRRELRPEYNRASGLDQVWLDNILYVECIAYDAKGQRALIAYGNGVMSRYAYDQQTFLLKEAGTIGDSALAQQLIKGDALNRRFDYDPIYRLLSATGRECDRPPEGAPWEDQPRCTDLTRTRAYDERYTYDPMGNMLRLEHRNEPGGFTRAFIVESANNRLLEVKVGETPYAYTFDANGNMHSETTSRHFEWGHADQMKAFRTQTDGAEPSVHAHYFYDAAGQRVKKVVRKQGGQVR